MPLDILICVFPNLPPWSHRGPALVLWVLLARNGFLRQCTSQQEKPGIYSLLSFFPWGWSLPTSPIPCSVTLGGWGHWKCSYSLQCVQTDNFIYSFLLQQSVQISPWKAGLLQGLCYPWVSAQVSTLQVFPSCSLEALRQICWRFLFLQPLLSAVWILLHAWSGRVPQDPLAGSAGSHRASCRGIFTSGWMSL